MRVPARQPQTWWSAGKGHGSYITKAWLQCQRGAIRVAAGTHVLDETRVRCDDTLERPLPIRAVLTTP